MEFTTPKSRAWRVISRCREKGGIKGWLGLAEQVSEDVAGVPPHPLIHFKDKMEQAGQTSRQCCSLFFKKMQIAAGCDAKRNVLVYMVYLTS